MSSLLPRLNILRLQGVPILKQLQYEEILLRRTSANWLLLNKDMPDLSIVLGFSGKIPELVDEHEVKKSDKSIELIRRYTGGGTVIVDDSTFFTSFIMNNKDAHCKPYPRDIMQWSNIVFQPVFEVGVWFFHFIEERDTNNTTFH